MLVLCVLYNKDKRQSQDNQDKAVQTKYRKSKKNPAGGMGVCVVYVVSTKGIEDKDVQLKNKKKSRWGRDFWHATVAFIGR
jgi:hypothetical protein